MSHEDERANWPSDEMAMSETKWLWPWRIFLGKPNDESSRVSCQTMMVLSTGRQHENPASNFDRSHARRAAARLAKARRDVPLEAVKIMSGFSDEVATAVIQLE